MKIIVLAPVHRYDDIRVFRKEAASLAAAGHEVVLFARTPDGKPRTENGVTVIPVNYRSRWQRFAQLPRLAATAYRGNADVYHLHNPDTLPLAAWLWFQGCCVIYDTHEDFREEILLRRWLPKFIRRPAAVAIAAAESIAGKILAGVIVTQEQLLSRIPEAVVIGNPPIVDVALARAALVARANMPATAEVTLGYLGGISEDRGLFRMLDLLGAMNEVRATRLRLIGYPVNDDALSRAKERPEWQWVDYRGELPQSEAHRQLIGVDAGLVLFQDVASHRHIDPNKIYEYMMLGIPFVATNFDDWRHRVTTNSAGPAGIFVDSNECPGEAARMVLDLVTSRERSLEASEAGVGYVVSEYSWQAAGAPMLFALYDRVQDAIRNTALRRP
ncbi:MAG: hypothetical protein CMH41_09720 [Micrococcales bacterium]|nr:hypothetical protein [Micrococcales bacterium]